MNSLLRLFLSYTVVVGLALLTTGAQAAPSAISAKKTALASRDTLNPAGFVITQVSTQAACTGNTVQVYFSSVKPVSTGTTFNAEFIEQNDPNAAAVAVPVSGTASPLELTMPTTLVPGSYLLRLASADGVLRAQHATPVRVTTQPIVRLSGDATIRRGEPALLDVGTNSTGLLTVGLSDGSIVLLDAANPASRRIRLSPTATTTYTITSVTSDCGTGTFSGSGTVTVVPGIRIDSLSNYRFCGGDTIRVYFSTDAALGADPAAWSLLIGPPSTTTGNLVSYTGIGKVLNVQNNVLTVAIPQAEGAIYSGVYSAQLLYKDPATGQAQYGVVHNRAVNVGTVPKAALPADFSTALDGPQGINLLVNVTGGRDYELTLSDGSTRRVTTDEQFFAHTTRFDLFVDKTTTYTVQSVRNRCGVGTVEGRVTVNLNNPDRRVLYLKKPDSLYCPNALLSLDFGTSGTFTATNEFRVELSDGLGDYYGNYVDTVRAAGAVSFPAPPDAGFYRLRIVATDPAITSNDVGFFVSVAEPKVTLTLDYKGVGNGFTNGSTTVVLPGTTAELALGFQGTPPFRYELSDGTFGQTTASFVSLQRYPQTTTTYSVKSLTTGCGTSQVSNSVTLAVQPILVRVGPVSAYACADNSLIVPLSAVGHVPDGTTYTVQTAADSATGIYRDLPTTGTPPLLRASLSADLVGKPYFLRVAAKAGSQTYVSRPTPTAVSVRTAPAVRLTTPDGQTAVQLDADQATVGLTLSSPVRETFSVLLSDGRVLDGFTNGSVYVAPANLTSATTYSIVSVSNVCGYGTAEGSVRVSYKPGLRKIQTSANELCAGSAWTVSYERVGEFASDNQFVFSLRDAGGLSTSLPATAVGEGITTLTVPASQKGGSYSLVVTATAPAQPVVSAGPQLTVRALATGELTGPVSVFKGDSAQLSIALTGTAPYTYTLATPTGEQTMTTAQSLYVIRLKPDTTVRYQLLSVADSQCGSGIASGTAVVTVTLLTANEPALPLSVSVYPNPTSSYLRIDGAWNNNQPVGVQMVDLAGHTVVEQSLSRSPVGTPGGTFTHDLDLSQLPTGTYLLRLRVGEQTDVRRVVKQ